MPDITLRIKGLAELDAKLKQLSTLAQERALRRAMFRPMERVLKTAQANAPRRSGALRLALTRMFTSARKGFAVNNARGLAARVAIAPRLKDPRAIALYNLSYGRRKRIRGIFYGHFLEFGTRKGTRATHFLGNALRAHAQHVIDEFAQELERAIERELKRR